MTHSITCTSKPSPAFWYKYVAKSKYTNLLTYLEISCQYHPQSVNGIETVSTSSSSTTGTGTGSGREGGREGCLTLLGTGGGGEVARNRMNYLII